MSAKTRLFRVSFVNQGQVYEVYAKSVSHGGMLGFVTWVVSEKHAARVAALLAMAVPIAAVIVLVQGMLVP